MSKLEYIRDLETECIDMAQRGIMPWGTIAKMEAETRRFVISATKAIHTQIVENIKPVNDVHLGILEMPTPVRNIFNGIKPGMSFIVLSTQNRDAKHIQAQILGAVSQYNKVAVNEKLICTVLRTEDRVLVTRIK